LALTKLNPKHIKVVCNRLDHGHQYGWNLPTKHPTLTGH